MTQSWEYATVRYENQLSCWIAETAALMRELGQGRETQMFDVMGADGWELVSSQPNVHYFKRPSASRS